MARFINFPKTEGKNHRQVDNLVCRFPRCKKPMAFQIAELFHDGDGLSSSRTVEDFFVQLQQKRYNLDSISRKINPLMRCP